MPAGRPIAIIDVGSNSVRLVVYAGARRAPLPLFNEKVLAGLGEEVGRTGLISDSARAKALAALGRFRLLVRHMQVRDLKVVATAAVRDAVNGPEFIDEVLAAGLDCRVISAEEEAWLAGEGVLSGFSEAAEGVVGDLGGGSLELVALAGGHPLGGRSLPLGVLRTGADAAAERDAAALLDSVVDDFSAAAGKPLYLVGGSWRALARIDMLLTDYPLPVAHGYVIAPERVAALRAAVAAPLPEWAGKIAPPRLASAPAAAMILDLLVRRIKPDRLIVSSFGIREGLVFSGLPRSLRQADPLIEAARHAGSADRGLGADGDRLDAWIAPLFDDPPAARRIRLATCLLAGLAWQASPDFRAERAVELALHGGWIGITAGERVAMAQALSTSFGRDQLPDPRLAALCTADQLQRARQWGSAIRFAQRLSGGVGAVLDRSAVELGEGSLRLRLARGGGALVSDGVRRRLKKLGKELGRAVEVALD